MLIIGRLAISMRNPHYDNHRCHATQSKGVRTSTQKEIVGAYIATTVPRVVAGTGALLARRGRNAFDGKLFTCSKLRAASESMEMFKDPDRVREARLFSRPRMVGTDQMQLTFEPANDDDSRERIADRLIAAYKLASRDAKSAPMKAADSDLWTMIVEEHMAELVGILNYGDTSGLRRFLRDFGSTYTWFGGLTLGHDGYFAARDASELACLFADKLACLAEAVGAAARECPEQGEYGRLPTLPIDDLVKAIEKKIGFTIEPPRQAMYTVGLWSFRGPLHYRHFNALYSALLTTRSGKRVCEFGAGLGLAAVYALRLGARDYTIFDLPIVNVVAGNYLLCALGENSVSLYGEPEVPNGVRVLPFWTCSEQSTGRFDVALNQDSFPEIDESLVRRYLDEIARTTVGCLISINQEAQARLTESRKHLWVTDLLSGDQRFERISRSPYWMREGYVEETYRVVGSR